VQASVSLGDVSRVRLQKIEEVYPRRASEILKVVDCQDCERSESESVNLPLPCAVNPGCTKLGSQEIRKELRDEGLLKQAIMNYEHRIDESQAGVGIQTSPCSICERPNGACQLTDSHRPFPI